MALCQQTTNWLQTGPDGKKLLEYFRFLIQMFCTSMVFVKGLERYSALLYKRIENKDYILFFYSVMFFNKNKKNLDLKVYLVLSKLFLLNHMTIFFNLDLSAS